METRDINSTRARSWEEGERGGEGDEKRGTFPLQLPPLCLIDNYTRATINYGAEGSMEFPLRKLRRVS